jgi:hypothetical protein
VNYENVRTDSPDTFTILGEVTNHGNQPADSVKVSASFYDANNQLVDVENVYPQLSTLQPGQSAPFEIVVSKSSNPLLQQIDSASFNVQSNEYSSVSIGQKIVVGPATFNDVATTTATSPSISPVYVYSSLSCGHDTHLNKKGECVPDQKEHTSNDDTSDKSKKHHGDGKKQQRHTFDKVDVPCEQNCSPDQD